MIDVRETLCISGINPMQKPIENALLEACNPQTEPDRLQQLSQWKRRHERSRLRQAIATNPSCDENLLLELAAEYPQEVIDNSRFQLLLLSGETWWEDSEPIALLMLLAELGPNAPPQMRRGFFDWVGAALISADPLTLNREWHMSFWRDITIEWIPDLAAVAAEHDNGDRRLESSREEECDSRESQARDFSIEFSCVVEGKNYFILNPPNSLDDPMGCIEALVDIDSSEELLAALEMHGWEEESDTSPGGQCLWKIESIAPELKGWDIAADLLGDGSGTIQVIDPSGKTHIVEVEAPDDYGDEYLNPTLEDLPDFIASVFVDSGKTTTELCNLLLKLIAVERQNGATDSNPCQP